MKEVEGDVERDMTIISGGRCISSSTRFRCVTDAKCLDHAEAETEVTA
jgi:hypothetical protein